MKHVLERTSPKGTEFIGTCQLCGATNLTIAEAFNDCPNLRKLTREEALIEAVTGPRIALVYETILGTWNGVCLNGQFAGWLMKKYPEGKWFPVRKLEESSEGL